MRDRRHHFPHVKCSICQQSVRRTKDNRIAVHFVKGPDGKRVPCEWSRRLCA